MWRNAMGWIMRLAVISVGNSSITTEQVARCFPKGVVEIVLGGEGETETCVRKYAMENHIKLTEFFLEAEFGGYAPVVRSIKMMDACDLMFVFWDGKCLQAKFLAERCKGKRIPCRMFKL